MNIIVEKLPKCVATLQVEVPAEKVASERGRILQGYASQAKIPGFRPGKAPAAVIAKRFEREITDELESRLVREAFETAIRQENLKVLSFKNPKDLRFDPSGVLIFAAEVILAPEFALGEYKGISVNLPAVEVSDAMVEANLTSLRERYADFTEITGRPLEMGDFAVIDYKATLDGQPLEEAIGRPAGYLGGRDGFWLKVDAESFLPGFGDAVVGMNAGETRDVALTIPDDFPLSEVRGREVVFTVTLNEIKQQTLPEANDEFAAKVLPGKSLEDIKGLIREQMTEQATREAEEAKVSQIVAHLNAQIDFELPDELVGAETQGTADSMVERGVNAGMSEEDISTQQNEIFAAAGQQARTNLKTNFILQEIARVESITVSDQDMLQRVAAMASQRRQPIQKLIKELQAEGKISGIRSSVLIGKVIDFLVENANVAETTTTIDE
jgi:trigger factor